jgi:hypothetical protein
MQTGYCAFHDPPWKMPLRRGLQCVPMTFIDGAHTTKETVKLTASQEIGINELIQCCGTQICPFLEIGYFRGRSVRSGNPP